ncbi:phosphoribosyl transferase-like protein [Dysgonomonas alginatilytica]|uniref:Phosphoribosyl transferase-like protein n=1 Tax=Dysgonomonas alginatilytica TaxID=1605892 RepID=A0A2V3PL54_9BACT|nr:phosphoribosyltransferase family protein [Dysgonomonas alginatilytica]PXV61870.1 phosphoribosyl transferase-like protein [Dysgonomonas alginatilytica]
MTSEQSYKGNITHFSGFLIDNEDEFGFSPDDYSKFKHGAINIAKEFGYLLADKFIEKCFKNHYDGKQIVVLPSAYSYIPTASFFMKVFFVEKLNLFLYKNGYPIVQETKINRTVTYREDYGEMSAEDRYNLISGDSFHVDKEYIKDKQLLFLDDIKITGTHERIILKMLNDSQISNDCYMLYFAELINSNISPKFENYLNNYFVKDLEKVDWIIKNEKFIFNTRVVKYILNADPDKFKLFINKQTIDFKKDVLYQAIGNEYFKFENYLDNINMLIKLI